MPDPLLSNEALLSTLEDQLNKERYCSSTVDTTSDADLLAWLDAL